MFNNIMKNNIIEVTFVFFKLANFMFNIDVKQLVYRQGQVFGSLGINLNPQKAGNNSCLFVSAIEVPRLRIRNRESGKIRQESYCIHYA